MVENGIGQSLPRKEDRRFLLGFGRYAPDITLANQCYAVMVRSPHGHARILAIDTAAARGAPGVLAVFTAVDFAADGNLPIPHQANVSGGGDIPLRIRPDFQVFTVGMNPLADGIVRHVGEPVAIVIAETHCSARDAAELVSVRYDPLPAVVHAADALLPGAPLVWDACAGNLSVDAEVGDEAATDVAFAAAAHVVRLDTWIHRVTGTPMEPRTAIGEHDPATGRYTIHAGTGGGVVRERETLAAVLGVPRTMPGGVWRHGRQFRHP
jgi:carbon-monoxide dehydrogenase large subunit